METYRAILTHEKQTIYIKPVLYNYILEIENNPVPKNTHIISII